MSAKNQKLNLNKELLYKYYITDNLTSKEVAKIFDCTSKTVRNYLIKYGIPVRQISEAVKLERSKWSENKEQVRSYKFMQTWQNTPEELKQKYIAKRTKNINSIEAIEKARATRKLNGTVKVSKLEIDWFHKLCTVFGKDDVVHQFKSDEYPYLCDFYIKSKSLYIEIQGHPTHGYEPYDINNSNHKTYLEQMQNAGFNMTTWIKRDIVKLQTAIQNKIKLLLIYQKNNTFYVHDGQLQNIGNINAIKISDLN